MVERNHLPRMRRPQRCRSKALLGSIITTVASCPLLPKRTLLRLTEGWAFHPFRKENSYLASDNWAINWVRMEGLPHVSNKGDWASPLRQQVWTSVDLISTTLLDIRANAFDPSLRLLKEALKVACCRNAEGARWGREGQREGVVLHGVINVICDETLRAPRIWPQSLYSRGH